MDRQAWEASGLPRPAEVTTAEQLARYRRVANAAPNFFWPGVPAAVRDRALACSTPARCASLSEALSTRDVVGSQGIAWLSAQGACDRGLTDRILRARPLQLEEQLDFFGTNFGIAISLGQSEADRH